MDGVYVYLIYNWLEVIYHSVQLKNIPLAIIKMLS